MSEWIARLASLYAPFIFACGTTHLLGAVVVWIPLYRFDALVRAVTAAASVATTFAVFAMMPQMLTFPSRRDLETANARLRDEIAERTRLERICAASERMGVLIDSLLELSRVTRSALVRERVDLSALAREVQRTIETELPRDGVTVTIEDGLEAEVDPKYARIVLENLLGNAWKYTARTQGPRIEFGQRPDRDHAGSVWFVRDNGAGFDMRHADKLFGVFQRLHAPDEFPGNGIGLATVQRIVARHGGRIWAEAFPGAGATFYFTLGDGGAEHQSAASPATEA